MNEMKQAERTRAKVTSMTRLSNRQKYLLRLAQAFKGSCLLLGPEDERAARQLRKRGYLNIVETSEDLLKAVLTAEGRKISP